MRAAIVAAAILGCMTVEGLTLSAVAVHAQASYQHLQGTYRADVPTPGGFKEASIAIDGIGDFTLIQPLGDLRGTVYRAVGRFHLRGSAFDYEDSGGARGTAILLGSTLIIHSRYPNGTSTTVTFRKSEL